MRGPRTVRNVRPGEKAVGVPEGPEIHRQAQRLRFLEGTLPLWQSSYEPIASLITQVEGQRITSVTARGKAFLIQLESGLTLYAHMQLYGRWHFGNTAVPPQTNRQVRLMLSAGKKAAWLLSATDVAWLPAGQTNAHPYLARLGPDLLDSAVSVDDLVRQLGDKRFQGRQLAQLLLDQAFWAGSGNYLRSEILFCAGQAPQQRPRLMTPDERTLLARAGLALARRSLSTGGVTNHPELVRELKARRQPRRAYRHWVFNREGQPCFLCGEPVMKSVEQGRRLYRCSGCNGGADLASEFPELGEDA